MKVLKSLGIGFILILVVYIMLALSMPSLGIAAIFLPNIAVLLTILILIGAAIIGLSLQFNKLEKGIISKRTTTNKISWIIALCVILFLMLAFLFQTGLLCELIGTSPVKCYF